MEIRKAENKDLKSIQELNYKLFDLDYNNYNPSLNMEWTYSEGEKYFKQLIENGTIWVAIDEKRVIGYLAGSIKKPSFVTNIYAELDNCYIEEEYRMSGIGKKLVSELKKYCRDNSIKEIKVSVWALNNKARAFYKSIGFKDFEITYKMKLDEE